MYHRTLSEPELFIKQDIMSIYQRLYPSLRHNTAHIARCLELPEKTHQEEESFMSFETLLEYNEQLLANPS